MKLKFDLPKGQRINHSFLGFTTFEGDWIFNEKLKRWENGELQKGCIYSSHQDCNSVRAFRRKLKKAPKGINFTLVGRWWNCDVNGINK
jgi:hypothetical protein